MDNIDLNKMSENEVIEYCRPIVRKIIQKHYKNHREFTRVHMISFDELEQFGMIGVLEGIRTFNDTKGMKLSSYLFSRITSAVNRYSKKASLRNINNYSYDLVDTVSLNFNVGMGSGDGEEWINVLATKKDYFEEKTEDLVIEQAIKKLMNDESIQKDYLAFLVCRIEGDSVLKISKKFKISRHQIQNILNKFEAKTSEILKLEVK